MKNLANATNNLVGLQKATVLGHQSFTDPLTFSSLLKLYRKRILQGFLLLIGTNIAALTLPSLINGAVSLVENSGAFHWRWLGFSISLRHLALACALIVLCTALSAFFRIVSRMVIFNIGRNIEKDVRKILFSHIITLSQDFFRRNAVGDLMNHMVSDVTNIRLCTGFLILNILNFIIVFVGTVPILFVLNPLTACVALTPFILVVIGTGFFSQAMFERTRTYQASLSKLTTHVQQALNALSVVRLFGQERKEEARFATANADAYAAGMKLSTVRIFLPPSMRALSGIGLALTVFFGGRAVLAEQLTLGDFVEINARLMQLSWPAMSLGFIISIYNRGQASLGRINKLLAFQPQIVDGPLRLSLKGNIEVEKLSLKEDAKTLLHNISFSVQPGQTVAIVGRIGSGKSTLVKALMREIVPAEGGIKFDGTAVEQLQLSSLFSQVVMVSSEPFLFSMSLRENMCFAKDDVSDEELQNVLKLVAFEHDLQQFPSGLDTLVGERGVTLSGGQKQRVALARALLAAPKILIMDNCLSAVDVENQRAISERLQQQTSISTLVIVTHRPSSITYAEQILVLKQGHLIQSGRHEQLIAECEEYQALLGLEQIEKGL